MAFFEDGGPGPVMDIGAELALLAAMMDPGNSGRDGEMATLEAAEIVAPRDFARPGHEVIFTALVVMRAAQEPVTVPTLTAWIERDGEMRALGGPTTGRVLIAEISGMPVPGVFAASHARLVWECSVRRHMAESGRRLVQYAAELDHEPAETITAAQAELARLAHDSVPDDNMAITASSFSATAQRQPPVVDGLLDHGDRAVVVATEGAGKSNVLTQVGYALAAGRHPFAPGTEIKPGRSLLIELEAPGGIFGRRLARFEEIAAQVPGWDPSRVQVFHRPGGVNLERAQDCFRLADVVRRAEPDLLIIGPVNKMYHEREHDGPAHAAIMRWLDLMRERHGCAQLIEHHVPISSAGGSRVLRPIGSARWSSWPEFGIALAKMPRSTDLRLDRFRGDREEGRMWPDRLSRRRTGSGWLWEATYPDGTWTEQADAGGSWVS
jgi:replicative DNA helicase